jgi:hypothetical protein
MIPRLRAFTTRWDENEPWGTKPAREVKHWDAVLRGDASQRGAIGLVADEAAGRERHSPTMAEIGSAEWRSCSRLPASGTRSRSKRRR